METLFLAVLSITLLFFVFLILKRSFPKICALCFAVSLTWIALLILSVWGYFQDQALLALLMGQTILGLFYLIESKAKEAWKIFRLPFLLTLILLALGLLGQKSTISMIMVGALWGLFGLLYLYQHNPQVNIFARKIIECCKRW